MASAPDGGRASSRKRGGKQKEKRAKSQAGSWEQMWTNVRACLASPTPHSQHNTADPNVRPCVAKEGFRP